MSRPICVHCGKPYGQRSTTSQHVRFDVGTEPPRYAGNGIVVKESSWHTGGGRGSMHGQPYGPNQVFLTRWVWDGESWWGGHDPFCTLRCALDYARKAYARSQQLKVAR